MDNTIVNNDNTSSGTSLLLIVSWIIVLIPLCYGIYKTFLKALALF